MSSYYARPGDLNIAPPLGTMLKNPRVASQKFVHEFSPRSGRHPLAHGVSRGSEPPPSPPSPLPPRRERGAEGGVRAALPRACALGYIIPPLRG